jgi:predicted metal-dependent HD superfamily phosphohydrolase
MHHDLQMTLERWLRLMAAWSFPRNPEVFDSLAAAYSEKWRHYHTAEHVSACLRHLDAVSARLDAPKEVEIALWFHDAIYKPLSVDNEKQSADWAAAFMLENGAATDAATRVHRLIMVTRHNAPTQTTDEAALMDIDLSILGTNPLVYARYEKQVRQEYRLVPAFLYRKKRAAILRGFLERPKIYTSGCLQDATEQQARMNLQHAIAELEGRI